MGSLFYFLYTGQTETLLPGSQLVPPTLRTIVYACVTAGLAHGASQALNMAEDAEMDRQTPHKQDRPIPSGVITVEEARSITWVLSFLALGRGFMINWRFGAMTAGLLGMGIFYNLDPVRAKERIIGIPWQAVSRGFFMFPMVWAAYGDLSSPIPWILGLFLFFYVLGFQNTADIIDRHTDAEFGISTWVVEYGVSSVVKIATACTGLMMITVGVGVATGVLDSVFLSLLGIVPFCLVMIFYMQEYPHSVSEKTGNHPAWLHYYIGMVLTVALPLVGELLLRV